MEGNLARSKLNALDFSIRWFSGKYNFPLFFLMRKFFEFFSNPSGVLRSLHLHLLLYQKRDSNTGTQVFCSEYCKIFGAPILRNICFWPMTKNVLEEVAKDLKLIKVVVISRSWRSWSPPFNVVFQSSQTL